MLQWIVVTIADAILLAASLICAMLAATYAPRVVDSRTSYRQRREADEAGYAFFVAALLLAIAALAVGRIG